MKRRAYVVGLLGSASLAAGCSDALPEVGTSESELVAETVHHVLLASGGFGSCSPDGVRGVLPSALRPLVQEIASRTSNEPTVVRTCFGGVGEPDRMEFAVSRGPFMLGGGTTTVANLEARLRTILDDMAPSRLDAYGHSHGGWLAGRVVLDLAGGGTDWRVANLYMSDPISRTQCTPQVVISGAFRSPECARFPRDLDPARLRAAVPGYFGTAYQTDDWLHSTPASGAENRFLNPGYRVSLLAQNHRALYELPLTLGLVSGKFVYR
ncbi:MAG: hypothetical protein U0169_06340 [Polyangiaceae bacterium]